MNARDDLQGQQNALRAMLGMVSEPIYLDMKPPADLTPEERWTFQRRLLAVEAELQRPTEAEPKPPVHWWQLWRRLGDSSLWS